MQYHLKATLIYISALLVPNVANKYIELQKMLISDKEKNVHHRACDRVIE